MQVDSKLSFIKLKMQGFYFNKKDTEKVKKEIIDLAIEDIKSILKEYSIEDFFNMNKSRDIFERVKNIATYSDFGFKMFLYSSPNEISDQWIEANRDRILEKIAPYLSSNELTPKEEKDIEKSFLISFIELMEIKFYLVPDSYKESFYTKETLFSLFLENNLLYKSNIHRKVYLSENESVYRLKTIYQRAKEGGYFTRDFRNDLYHKISEFTSTKPIHSKIDTSWENQRALFANMFSFFEKEEFGNDAMAITF